MREREREREREEGERERGGERERDQKSNLKEQNKKNFVASNTISGNI
jgi:hypothetical protein